MPSYQGEFKTMALEILLSRAETIPDLFVTLQAQDLLGLLSHRLFEFFFFSFFFSL